MTPSTDTTSNKPGNPGVRRGDWVLLPLLGLLTMALVAVSAELFARRTFTESATGLESCLVVNDLTTGVRGIPNSVCREKYLESPMVEFRLDGAGYRSGMVLGPKQPETFRIVLIGSSTAMGERVPFESTMAALLPAKLSHQTGRKVELYNEGMADGFPRNASLRFHDALEANPDLILWVLTPIDIERAGFTYAKNAFNKPPPSNGLMNSVKNATLDFIRKQGGTIVIGQALRHWLYELQSQRQYIQSYLLNRPDDSEAGFLKAQLSPKWTDHVMEFDAYAADIAARARAAGVPLVATFAPNRAQAAMISLGEWPQGFDPYRLDHELQSIISAHGGIYIDILPAFRSVPGPEHLYYPLDGHPKAEGQALLADLLARKFADGPVPELKAVAPAADRPGKRE
jgi:hypothetical protein